MRSREVWARSACDVTGLGLRQSLRLGTAPLRGVFPIARTRCAAPFSVIAKFHYTDTDTDPTRTRHGPDTDKVRARSRLNSTTRTRHGPERTQRSFAAKKSVRVRSGPCRVRVVEFSSSPTTCADFVWSGPVRVGSVSVWWNLAITG